MQSTAPTVEEYLQEIPAERLPALIRLRSLYQGYTTFTIVTPIKLTLLWYRNSW